MQPAAAPAAHYYHHPAQPQVPHSGKFFAFFLIIEKEALGIDREFVKKGGKRDAFEQIVRSAQHIRPLLQLSWMPE